MWNNKTTDIYTARDKEYYLDELREIVNRLSTDNSEKTQHECYDLLWKKYAANLNSKHKFALSQDELSEFFRLTKNVLALISDAIIMDKNIHQARNLRFIYRNLFMYMKYDGDLDILNRRFYIEDEILFFEQKGISYDLRRDQKLVVRAINTRNGVFSIDAQFMTDMLYWEAPEAIYAEVNEKQYKVNRTEYYAYEKVFGISIDRKYTFNIAIPINELLNRDENIIEFYLSLDGNTIVLPLDFNRAPSKLCNTSVCKHSYWMLDDVHIMTYDDCKIMITIPDSDTLEQREKLFRKEGVKHINKRTIRRIYKSKKFRNHIIKRNFHRDEFLRLREDYFKYKEEYKSKRVWMYFDKLTNAGDNGEYAFRYAYHNDKEIEPYYIINEDSVDYNRLIQEFPNNILTYRSHEAMLMALFAEVVVATHPDIIEFFGYDTLLTSLMKDLFNPYLVCIAHGVTIQKNADYQNKLFDNTMFYTTTSKYEVQHLLHPVYGYGMDEIALTGMARFDGLINDDKRQILISPTWRRNLVGKGTRNGLRQYNEFFKESQYYKIYNGLINDDRLIVAAKNYGYGIVFLIHPAMNAQAEDYDKNEYVRIIQVTEDMGYEQLLRESSLLVTDYSGIHYDFAYMRKPVIYYQPKEVPMRFEEGGLKFYTMGFGPVCDSYDAVINLLCEYMSNDCGMPSEYKKRADDFFEFDDHNNCERIHDAIKETLNVK